MMWAIAFLEAWLKLVAFLKVLSVTGGCLDLNGKDKKNALGFYIMRNLYKYPFV